MKDGVMKGRCFCSSVKYDLVPPTEMCSHCHCESCRRSHGSAFATWTSVPLAQFKVAEGKSFVKKYESSQGIFWLFCSDCGSPLFQTTRHSPGRVYVNVASLEDSLDRKPDSHVSFEEKVPWLEVKDGLPCYKEKASDRLSGEALEKE